jgi:hypothetical protein
MSQTTKIIFIVVGSLVAVCVVCACGVGLFNVVGKGGSSANANATFTTSGLVATDTPAGPTATIGPTATPKPVYAHFGDGTYQVGKDIKPGTYRTRDASSGCYYARLKSFDGSTNAIIANNNTDNPAIITIYKTDVGFTSSNCGTWTADLSQITSSKTQFDDGMYIVGVDITPGTYKNDPGNDTCYWERMSNFGNDLYGIIANDNPTAQAIVTIRSTDKGFFSERCGTWHKI